MSFCVNTSMLTGTSCRFSSRLRAVTTTSCSAPAGGLRGGRGSAGAARGGGAGQGGRDGETDPGASPGTCADVFDE